MFKTRALTDVEYQICRESFGGEYGGRDKALFVLLRRSGFRISEALSLRLADVVENGGIRDRITVEKKHMKGKVRSRDVAVHSEVKEALRVWIRQLNGMGYMHKDCFVFQSRKGGNRPISRVQAHRILKEAFDANELRGHVACHSLRKTLAQQVYGKGHDLFLTQQVLGHANVNSTIKYLDIHRADVDAAILNA